MNRQWLWRRFDELSLRELYAVLKLRQEVFVVEQTCAFLDADERDFTAAHLLGLEEGRLVAYLRVHAGGVLQAEAVISRVITAQSHRRQGLGLDLLGRAVRYLQASAPDAEAWLGAQQRLQSFYGRFGFRPVGEPYLEDGIWHIGMQGKIDRLHDAA